MHMSVSPPALLLKLWEGREVREPGTHCLCMHQLSWLALAYALS